MTKRPRTVGRKGERIRSEGWRGRARGLSILLLALGVGPGLGGAAALAGQETRPEGDEEGERCVCIDRHRLDAEAREAMERAREAMREARQRVREARVAWGRRARLGIEIDRPRDPGGADEGVGIRGVAQGSPAERGGLAAGDRIVAFDGHPLDEALPDDETEASLDREESLPVQRLLHLLAEREPGDSVLIAYLRDGDRRSTTVELGPTFGAWRPSLRGRGGGSGEGPGPVPVPFPGIVFRGEGWRGSPPGLPRGAQRWRSLCRELDGPSPGLLGRRCVAGLQVEALGPELGSYFGTERGVLVLDVVPDAPLGLEPGDVILAVDGRSVETVSDLRRILDSYREEETVTFRIRRQGGEEEVQGRVP